MVKSLRKSGWAYTLPLALQKIPSLLEVHLSKLYQQSRREEKASVWGPWHPPGWCGVTSLKQLFSCWSPRAGVPSPSWPRTPSPASVSSGLGARPPCPSPSYNSQSSSGCQTFRNLFHEVKKQANSPCASAFMTSKVLSSAGIRAGPPPLSRVQDRHWAYLLLLFKIYFFFVTNCGFCCVL